MQGCLEGHIALQQQQPGHTTAAVLLLTAAAEGTGTGSGNRKRPRGDAAAAAARAPPAQGIAAGAVGIGPEPETQQQPARKSSRTADSCTAGSSEVLQAARSAQAVVELTGTASKGVSTSKDVSIHSDAGVLAAAQAASQGFCLLADWAAALAGGPQQQQWLQQLQQLRRQVGHDNGLAEIQLLQIITLCSTTCRVLSA